MSKGVEVSPKIYSWNPGSLADPLPKSELFSYGGYEGHTHYLYIKENCWAKVLHVSTTHGVSMGGYNPGTSYSMDTYWQPLTKGNKIQLVSWDSGGSTEWATDSNMYTIYPIKK